MTNTNSCRTHLRQKQFNTVQLLQKSDIPFYARQHVVLSAS